MLYVTYLKYCGAQSTMKANVTDRSVMVDCLFLLSLVVSWSALKLLILFRNACIMIEFMTRRRVKGMKQLMVVRNQEYPTLKPSLSLNATHNIPLLVTIILKKKVD